jgi:hypothetical protein
LKVLTQTCAFGRPEANLASTVCVGLKLLPVNTQMNHVLYELPLLTSQQYEVIAWTQTAFHLFRIFKNPLN